MSILRKKLTTDGHEYTRIPSCLGGRCRRQHQAAVCGGRCPCLPLSAGKHSRHYPVFIRVYPCLSVVKIFLRGDFFIPLQVYARKGAELGNGHVDFTKKPHRRARKVAADDSRLELPSATSTQREEAVAGLAEAGDARRHRRRLQKSLSAVHVPAGSWPEGVGPRNK